MADEKEPGPGPLADAIFVLGVIVVLVAVWFYTGGPKRADLRGIFLHSPEPLGQGGAYGPQVGTLSSSSINASGYTATTSQTQVEMGGAHY